MKKEVKNLIHAQTLLFVDDMEALKRKTGEKQTQAALDKAIQHYLNCDNKVN